MKGIIVLITVLFSLIATAQEGKQKIRIALLGTMHFTPSSQDTYSNEKFILSDSKQKEIDEVIKKLAAFNPDQVCVEVPVENQEGIDRQYSDFLKGKYELELNEIDVLGFQTAKLLKLPQVACINYLGNFDMEPVNDYALKNGQQPLLDDIGKHGTKLINDMNEKQNSLTVSQSLIYLNSKEALNQNLSFYTNNVVKVGTGKDYPGAELVAEWYKTNLHIYANILRVIKPSDKAILVIFGQGHIPILKHLFMSNPDYEVVEISELLQ